MAMVNEPPPSAAPESRSAAIAEALSTCTSACAPLPLPIGPTFNGRTPLPLGQQTGCQRPELVRLRLLRAYSAAQVLGRRHALLVLWTSWRNWYSTARAERCTVERLTTLRLAPARLEEVLHNVASFISKILLETILLVFLTAWRLAHVASRQLQIETHLQWARSCDVQRERALSLDRCVWLLSEDGGLPKLLSDCLQRLLFERWHHATGEDHRSIMATASPQIGMSNSKRPGVERSPPPSRQKDAGRHGAVARRGRPAIVPKLNLSAAVAKPAQGGKVRPRAPSSPLQRDSLRHAEGHLVVLVGCCVQAWRAYVKGVLSARIDSRHNQSSERKGSVVVAAVSSGSAAKRFVLRIEQRYNWSFCRYCFVNWYQALLHRRHLNGNGEGQHGDSGKAMRNLSASAIAAISRISSMRLRAESHVLLGRCLCRLRAAVLLARQHKEATAAHEEVVLFTRRAEAILHLVLARDTRDYLRKAWIGWRCKIVALRAEKSANELSTAGGARLRKLIVSARQRLSDRTRAWQARLLMREVFSILRAENTAGRLMLSRGKLEAASAPCTDQGCMRGLAKPVPVSSPLAATVESPLTPPQREDDGVHKSGSCSVLQQQATWLSEPCLRWPDSPSGIPASDSSYAFAADAAPLWDSDCAIVDDKEASIAGNLDAGVPVRHINGAVRTDYRGPSALAHRAAARSSPSGTPAAVAGGSGVGALSPTLSSLSSPAGDRGRRLTRSKSPRFSARLLTEPVLAGCKMSRLPPKDRT